LSGDYQAFLARKAAVAPKRGLEVLPTLSGSLKPFQRAAVSFLLECGSGGLFLDTGLGKTICQLEWATHAAAASNGRALILTPLAVAWQIKEEADRFGYQARVIRSQDEAGEGINICNYDRVDALDTQSFGAAALDESSIIKNFTGKTTRLLTDRFLAHRWKLCATATPAPNDHMEIGTHAEFCSVMASNEMLSRFFINDTSTASQQWRLKGHAERPFWDWMASWSRMASLPSDLGDNDEGYFLPPMHVFSHQAEGQAPIITDGLFGALEVSATSIYDIKRQTAEARARMARDVVLRELRCGSLSTPALDGSAPLMIPPTGHNATLKGTALTKRPAANTCDATASLTRQDWTSSGGPKLLSGTPDAESDTSPTSSSERSTRRRSVRAARSNVAMDASVQPSESPQTTMIASSPNKTEVAPSAEPSATVAGDAWPSITVTRPEPSAASSAPTATMASASSETTPSASFAPQNTSGRPDSWIVWCDTDAEQDELERNFGGAAISIRGSQPSETKEYLCRAWLAGERPILISKPSIFGYGMNFQHCRNMVFVGRTFSYETWYQAVRRCWRFGQKHPVSVHLIVAEGEDAIGRVIDRKADDHARMKAAMSLAMRRDMSRTSQTKVPYLPTHSGRLPAWLCAA
jgi:hypothetical protein